MRFWGLLVKSALVAGSWCLAGATLATKVADWGRKHARKERG